MKLNWFGRTVNATQDKARDKARKDAAKAIRGLRRQQVGSQRMLGAAKRGNNAPDRSGEMAGGWESSGF